jgi:hypothetical protein
LLATLQRRDLLAGRVLKIHCKEERPDHQARDAGGDILADLEALLGTKLGDLLIIGLDLGGNGRAIRISILWLHDRGTHGQTNLAHVSLTTGESGERFMRR